MIKKEKKKIDCFKSCLLDEKLEKKQNCYTLLHKAHLQEWEVFKVLNDDAVGLH